MPYKIRSRGKGFKVTTPNHPQGFSKKPMSRSRAVRQLRAIKMNSQDENVSLEEAPKNKIKFTVPEVWRKIVKWSEPQGAQKFDILICGHAVPVSDTSYRKFRACPDCRIKVQQYADEHGGSQNESFSLKEFFMHEEEEKNDLCSRCNDGHHTKAGCSCPCYACKELAAAENKKSTFSVNSKKTKTPKLSEVFRIHEDGLSNIDNEFKQSQIVPANTIIQNKQKGLAAQKNAIDAVQKTGGKIKLGKPTPQQPNPDVFAVDAQGNPSVLNQTTSQWSPLPGAQKKPNSLTNITNTSEE